jgi:hypothetical protein
MFCLAFGRSPFETSKEGVLRLAILNGRYQAPAGNRMRQCTFSDAYMDLIQQMLQVDHTQRPFNRLFFWISVSSALRRTS